MAPKKKQRGMVFHKEGATTPAAAPAINHPSACLVALTPGKASKGGMEQSTGLTSEEADIRVKHNMYPSKEAIRRVDGLKDPASSNPQSENLSPDCICKGIKVTLDNNNMWNEFFRCRTEMILTKHGSRMFPYCRFRISGLQPSKKYCLIVDIQPLDNSSYKWTCKSWQVAGKAECHVKSQPFCHPESPATGQHWMQSPVSFYRLKLTNNILDQEGNTILHPMHRYLPRLHVVQTEKAAKDIKLNGPTVVTFTFPQTEFISVTAYQNTQFAQLKVDYNPFAKGLKEDGSSLWGLKLKANSGKELHKDRDTTTTEQHSVKRSLKSLLANHKPRCSKAVDSKPTAAADLKPTAAADLKPTAAADSKPTAAADSKPTAALDSKPTAALDSKPTAALDSKPTAALDSKPTAAADSKALPPKNLQKNSTTNKDQSFVKVPGESSCNSGPGQKLFSELMREAHVSLQRCDVEQLGINHSNSLNGEQTNTKTKTLKFEEQDVFQMDNISVAARTSETVVRKVKADKHLLNSLNCEDNESTGCSGAAASAVSQNSSEDSDRQRNAEPASEATAKQHKRPARLPLPALALFLKQHSSKSKKTKTKPDSPPPAASPESLSESSSSAAASACLPSDRAAGPSKNLSSNATKLDIQASGRAGSAELHSHEVVLNITGQIVETAQKPSSPLCPGAIAATDSVGPRTDDGLPSIYESPGPEPTVPDSPPVLHNSDQPFCTHGASTSTLSSTLATSSSSPILSPLIDTVLPSTSSPHTPTESSTLRSDSPMLKAESLLLDPECSSFSFEPLSPASSPEPLPPLLASIALELDSTTCEEALTEEPPVDLLNSGNASVFKWHTVLPPPEPYIETSFTTFQPTPQTLPLMSVTPPLLPSQTLSHPEPQCLNIATSTSPSEAPPSFQENEQSLPFPAELSPLALQLPLSPTFSSLGGDGLSPTPSIADLVHFFSTDDDLGMGVEFANTEAVAVPCPPPPTVEAPEPPQQVQPVPARKPCQRKKCGRPKQTKSDTDQKTDDSTYKNMRPNLEEVEEQLFISFTSKEALKLHIVDSSEGTVPPPQSPPESLQTAEAPENGNDAESLEETIAAFQAVLLRDLKLMKHRQVIHPVLQEVGLKMTLLDPNLAIDLQYLGVRLPIPPPGVSLELPPPQGASAVFVSRTGKTTDVTQIKGWRDKFTPSEAPPTPAASLPEACPGPSSDLPKKNLSAFCSDMLDEYLENEGKLIDERAASFSQPPVEPPVYELPTRSTSYVRTLDHILKKQSASSSASDLISGFIPPSKRPRFSETKIGKRAERKQRGPKSNKPRPEPEAAPGSETSPAESKQLEFQTPADPTSNSAPQSTPPLKKRRKLKPKTSSQSLSPSRSAVTPPRLSEDLAPLESDSGLMSAGRRREDTCKRSVGPLVTRTLLRQRDLEDNMVWDGRPRTWITDERAAVALTSLFTLTGFVSENPTAPIQLVRKHPPRCLNEFCRLGCICSSLSYSSRSSHCGRPSCMFGCSCLKQKVVLLKNLDGSDSSPHSHQGNYRKKRRRKRRMKMAYILKEADSVSQPAERVRTLWGKDGEDLDPEPVHVPQVAPHSLSTDGRKNRSSCARVRGFRGKIQKLKDAPKGVRGKAAQLKSQKHRDLVPKETETKTSTPPPAGEVIPPSFSEPPPSPPAEQNPKPSRRLVILADCKWVSDADRSHVLKKLCEAMAQDKLDRPFWLKKYLISPISQNVEGSGLDRCIQYKIHISRPEVKQEKQMALEKSALQRHQRKINSTKHRQVGKKAEPLEDWQKEVIEETGPPEDWQKEVMEEVALLDNREQVQKLKPGTEDTKLLEFRQKKAMKKAMKKVKPLDVGQKEAMKKAKPLDIGQKEAMKKAKPLDVGQKAAMKKAKPLDVGQKAAMKKAKPLDVGQKAAMKKAKPLDVGQKAAMKKAKPLDVGQKAAMRKAKPLDVGQKEAMRKAKPLDVGQKAAMGEAGTSEDCQQAMEEGGMEKEEEDDCSGYQVDGGKEREEEKLRSDKKKFGLGLPFLRGISPAGFLSAQMKQPGGTDHLVQVNGKLYPLAKIQLGKMGALHPANRLAAYLTGRVLSKREPRASSSPSPLACKPPPSSEPTLKAVSSASSVLSGLAATAANTRTNTTTSTAITTAATPLKPQTTVRLVTLPASSTDSQVGSLVMGPPGSAPSKASQVVMVQVPGPGNTAPLLRIPARASTGQKMVLKPVQTTSGLQYYRRPDGKLVQLVPISQLRPFNPNQPAQKVLSAASSRAPITVIKQQTLPVTTATSSSTFLSSSTSSSLSSLSSSYSLTSSSLSLPLSTMSFSSSSSISTTSSSTSTSTSTMPPIPSESAFAAKKGTCTFKILPSASGRDPIVVTCSKAPDQQPTEVATPPGFFTLLQPQPHNSSVAPMNLISLKPSASRGAEPGIQTVTASAVPLGPEGLLVQQKPASPQTSTITQTTAEATRTTTPPPLAGSEVTPALPPHTPTDSIGAETEVARDLVDLDIVCVDDDMGLDTTETLATEVVEVTSSSETDNSSDFRESESDEEMQPTKNNHRHFHTVQERNRRVQLKQLFDSLRKQLGLTEEKSSKIFTLNEAVQVIQELRRSEADLKERKRRLRKERDDYLSVIAPPTDQLNADSVEVVDLLEDADEFIEISSDEENIVVAETTDVANAADDVQETQTLQSDMEKVEHLKKCRSSDPPPAMGAASVPPAGAQINEDIIITSTDLQPTPKAPLTHVSDPPTHTPVPTPVQPQSLCQRVPQLLQPALAHPVASHNALVARERPRTIPNILSRRKNPAPASCQHATTGNGEHPSLQALVPAETLSYVGATLPVQPVLTLSPLMAGQTVLQTTQTPGVASVTLNIPSLTNQQIHLTSLPHPSTGKMYRNDAPLSVTNLTAADLNSLLQMVQPANIQQMQQQTNQQQLQTQPLHHQLVLAGPPPPLPLVVSAGSDLSSDRIRDQDRPPSQTDLRPACFESLSGDPSEVRAEETRGDPENESLKSLLNEIVFLNQQTVATGTTAGVPLPGTPSSQDVAVQGEAEKQGHAHSPWLLQLDSDNAVDTDMAGVGFNGHTETMQTGMQMGLANGNAKGSVLAPPPLLQMKVGGARVMDPTSSDGAAAAVGGGGEEGKEGGMTWRPMPRLVPLGLRGNLPS
ncbi:MAX dimerization protein MGA a isoform X1 [Embiotoca jacksoni]|uniref:MAX dimerization protein MGA a isoform X1 n=1 Tax=Embiotoca jacksoni TaxID=100190 RepID=UPI003704BB96